MAVNAESGEVKRAVLTPFNGMILLTVAAIAVTVWSYRYFGQYRPFADLTSQSDNTSLAQIGLQLDNATIAVRSGGQRRFRVNVDRVTFSRDRSWITLDGLRDGILYDNTGKPAIDLNAGQIVCQTLTGAFSSGLSSYMLLSGGIQANVVATGGLRMETDRINWDARSDVVDAPGPVNIVFARNSGFGIADNVLYNSRTHEITVQHIHGVIHVSQLLP